MLACSRASRPGCPPGGPGRAGWTGWAGWAGWAEYDASSWPDSPAYAPGYPLRSSGYAPDGTAGRTAAYPLAAVSLLDSPFRANQLRNLNYLLFLDPERMLHTFRLNYGVPSSATPCGGWESPNFKVRGHTTGHLLSGLALSYANTGNPQARAMGEYLVAQLAGLQAIAPLAGYAPGYLSAFPESFFERARGGRPRLVALLHDPQVPGGHDRPVSAGRRRPGARRGDAAGRLGGHQEPPG